MKETPIYRYRTGQLSIEEAKEIFTLAKDLGWEQEEEVCFYLLSRTNDFKVNTYKKYLSLDNLSTETLNVDRFNRHLLDSQGWIAQVKNNYRQHRALVEEIIKQALYSDQCLGTETREVISCIKKADNYWNLLEIAHEFIFTKWKDFHFLFNRTTPDLEIKIGKEGGILTRNSKPLSINELTELLESLRRQHCNNEEVKVFIKGLINYHTTPSLLMDSNIERLIEIFNSYWYLFEGSEWEQKLMTVLKLKTEYETLARSILQVFDPIFTKYKIQNINIRLDENIYSTVKDFETPFIKLPENDFFLRLNLEVTPRYYGEEPPATTHIFSITENIYELLHPFRKYQMSQQKNPILSIKIDVGNNQQRILNFSSTSSED